MSRMSPSVQKRILTLLRRGHDSKQIARMIGVQARTVGAVKANVTRGPAGRRAAAQKAWKNRPRAFAIESGLWKRSLRVVTDAGEIREAYRILARRLQKGALAFNRTVGWAGGNRRVTVHWHRRHRFWAALSPHINRNHYWIGFGLQDPRKHPDRVLNITCEVNPPHQGIDRRCGGIFLRGSARNILLCHTGKVGGGGEGIGKHSFLHHYPGKMQPVKWTGDKKSSTMRVVVLGKIDGSELLPNLARFIVDVDAFKESVKGPPNTALLDDEVDSAESEGWFDPDNTRDGRQKMLRSIVERRGQQAFRKKLLSTYKGRCAATGCDCAEVLEAAHIKPYLGPDTDHTTNGLLLRSDLHTLFDLGKISVSNRYTLLVSKELLGTEYGKLNGKPLTVPKDRSRQPNRKALAEHRAGLTPQREAL
jgi:HNH endonuclease